MREPVDPLDGPGKAIDPGPAEPGPNLTLRLPRHAEVGTRRRRSGELARTRCVAIASRGAFPASGSNSKLGGRGAEEACEPSTPGECELARCTPIFAGLTLLINGHFKLSLRVSLSGLTRTRSPRRGPARGGPACQTLRRVGVRRDRRSEVRLAAGTPRMGDYFRVSQETL